jgi:hypothetical protein
MRRRIGRRYIVRLRLSVRGLRRRLQPYRLLIAGLAGGLGAILATVYGQIETSLRIVTIVAIGLLTAFAVVLTEPPDQKRDALPREPARPQIGAPPGSRAAAGGPPAPRRPRLGAVEPPPPPPPRRPRVGWWHWWPRRIAPNLPPGTGCSRGAPASCAS